MFFDRYDAGQQLAQKLKQYKSTDTIVYALPRGGVLTGFEVAKALGAPLDLVITRKIGHPINKEYAICAITEDGERVCDQLGLCGVDESWIEYESSVQQEEAHRRRMVYKGNTKSISAKNKIAVLVDDGVATGLTMKSATRTIQKQKPKQIVVAVPVIPHDILVELQQLVDVVITLKDEQQYRGSVSAYYTHFPEVFDKVVQACLKQAAQDVAAQMNSHCQRNEKIACVV